jgi:hypothetical protein
VLKHKVVRRSVFGAGTVALLAVVGVASIVAWLDWRFRPPSSNVDVATLRREVAALRVEHEQLRQSLTNAKRRDDLLDEQPAGDVSVALPNEFVAGVVIDIVTGWFDKVDVHLRDIRLRKSGTVRARMGLLGRRTVGDYSLGLHLHDVQGRLAPEPPVLTFGGDAIGVALPVQLVGGIGRGTMALTWDSRGLAGPVCGDLVANHVIEGTVIPQRYMARGRLRLSANGGGITATPEFPGLAMRLRVQPSRRAVQALEDLLRSKGPLCDVATSQGNVERRVLDLVGRGFLVRIPQHFFRAVRLPISVYDDLSLLEQQVRITVRPNTARITPQAVWLSAKVLVQPLD